MTRAQLERRVLALFPAPTSEGWGPGLVKLPRPGGYTVIDPRDLNQIQLTKLLPPPERDAEFRRLERTG